MGFNGNRIVQTPHLDAAGCACGFFGKSHLEPELSLFTEKLPTTAPYYGFTPRDFPRTT